MLLCRIEGLAIDFCRKDSRVEKIFRTGLGALDRRLYEIERAVKMVEGQVRPMIDGDAELLAFGAA
jgi:hypothetical protein